MVPLIADPGARWHYGVGLDLLGAVIERASGQPFDDFLKDRLFDPLDMDDTGFQVPQRRMPRFVANYLLTPKGLQPFDMPPDTIYALKPAFPFGGSGLVSRSEEHPSELQSLMRISYAVFCLKKKYNKYIHTH